MNIPTFFRFLNSKIEKYDKLANNPFLSPKPFIIIWIEEVENNDKK